MGRNRRNALLIQFAGLFCISCSLLRAQTTGPEPGVTFPGVAPGSPGGSYALSGFDTVNLFNGHLNARIPIVTIGGRGEAGYTMKLPLQPEYFTVFNPAPSGTYVGGPAWSPPLNTLTPGVLELRTESLGPYPCQANPSAPGYTVLTRLIFSDAEGSEHALYDTLTYGLPNSNVQCPYGGGSRGTEFVALDGSGMVFVSNYPISDLVGLDPSGQLHFRDGRAYEITGGLVTAIRDRNGNLVTLQYENQASLGTANDTATHLLSSVTDPIGRVATITNQNYQPGPGGITTISYAGKNYQIYTQPLGTLSEVTQDFMNQNLTPPGWITTTARSDFIQNGASRQSVATMLSGSGLSISTTSLWMPEVTSALTLPNNQSYTFLYNRLGEISQINLPTGGAILYDFDFALGVTPPNYSQPVAVLGVPPNYTIYRRLTKRRIFRNASDSSPEHSIDYSTQTKGGSIIVTLTHRDGSSNITKTQQHTFTNAPELETTTNYSQPFGYPNWNEGLETFLQESSPSTTGSRTLENFWVQQTLPAAIASQVSMYPGSVPPPFNPRISQTYTSVDGATSAQAYCYDDTQTFNNQTDVYEYGFGTYPISGACPSLSPGYVRHTHTDYKIDVTYTSDAVRLLGLPIRQQIEDASDTLIAETDYSYDGGTLASDAGMINIINHLTTVATISSFPVFDTSYTTRGNVTGVSHYVSAGNWVSTSANYDIAGNVVAAIDGNQNPTTYDYTDAWGNQGSFGGGTPVSTLPTCNPSSQMLPCAKAPQSYTYAFQTKVTNALSQPTTLWYAYNAGRPAAVADPNGAVTYYDYTDPLMRLKSIRYPGGGSTIYSYADAPGSVSVLENKSLGTPFFGATCSNPAWVSNQTFYDGLGREISLKNSGPNGWISVDQTYDSLGRLFQVSNPYEAGGPGPEWTTYSYDALDRVVKVTAPDTSFAQTAYFSDISGSYLQAQITDPANNSRTTYSDGLGRLVRVFAQGPASVSGQSYTPADYTTNYTYDALDNLKLVVTSQASLNRTFTYDGLSRLTSASNPENGTVQYTLYDGNGNLKTKIANGITTTYYYDALNRLTQRRYDDGITPTVNYLYDLNYVGANNYPIGRLSQVSTAGSNVPTTSLTYSRYDALGRVTETVQNTGGQSYPFTYSYNDQALESITYPSQRKIAYCYDAAVRVQEVKNLTQANLPSYATGIQYHDAGGRIPPSGEISQMTLGNNILETRNYNSRSQVTQIQAGNLLTLGYDYGTTNNNGNLLSQTITRSTQNGPQTWTQNYGYTDGLNRLTSAQETGAGTWSQIYDYDPWANQWLDPASSGLAVDPFTPQFPSNFDPTNHMILQNPAYDGGGNQTQIGGLTFSYDAENRLIAAYLGTNSMPVSSTGYVYDGDGRRVQKITCPAGINPCNATSPGASFTTYVYDGMGQLAAEYGVTTDSGTNYITTDHLGSTRLVTDSTGTAVRCYDYLPFGAEIAANAGRTDACFNTTLDADHIKFTGQFRDSETGLDWFNTRYYSSSQGRFIMPDEPFAGFDQRDPQSFNLYSYAENNPLRFTDPDGHDVQVCIVDSGCYMVSDPVYADLYNQQNGQQGITLPGGPFPSGTITCGDQVCGAVRYFEPPTEEAPLELALIWDFAASVLENTVSGIVGLIIRNTARDTTEEGPLVIGKLSQLEQPGTVRPFERVLDLGKKLPEDKANWARNSSLLRKAMRARRPIRDASGGPRTYDLGLDRETGFLRAERNLLRNSRWWWDGGYWYPPVR